MANIIIAAEHQSSPKETDNTRIVRNAAHDIASGKFKPEITDEFFDVGISALLAQHPAVREALDKLEYAQVPKTNAEYLEKAHMLFEANEELGKKARWEGQERWQGAYNEAIRTVNPMTPSTFIRKLQAIGVKAEEHPQTVVKACKNPLFNPFATTIGDWPEGANGWVPPQVVNPEPEYINMEVVETEAQVYLGIRVIDGCVALNAKVWNEEKKCIEDVRVNKLQVPLSPEWSVMAFDEYSVPSHEKFHGWRTALLALITRGVITKKQAHVAFGKPEGEAASFYKQQLFMEGY